MSGANTPKLGELITGAASRDAIHVAVAPMVAGQKLNPGEPVMLGGLGAFSAVSMDTAIGIVDPYLDSAVNEGERFWLCLMPGTVTSLRHEWEHPAFPKEKPTEAKVSEQLSDEQAAAMVVIHHAAKICDLTFTRMMAAADNLADGGDPIMDNSEAYKACEFDDEFWTAFKTLTGKDFPERGGWRTPFTCSC
jgi:hypothetical protein